MKCKSVRVWAVLMSLFLFLAAMPYNGHAAVPEKISYQGNLTNSLGAPVTGSVQMVFSIYSVDTGGTALWSETQTVIVSNAAYSVVLGSVTPLSLPFDNQYYLGVKVGTDAEMTPRRPLTSIGYSMRAKVADSTPLGMVVAYAGPTAPSGCDGSEVSRTTYAALFAAIGTIYGVGDGSTTFNIPDYRGVFLRGVDGGFEMDPDAALRWNADGSQGNNGGSWQYTATSGFPDSYNMTTWPAYLSLYYPKKVSQVTYYPLATETRPTNVSVNWIIKY